MIYVKLHTLHVMLLIATIVHLKRAVNTKDTLFRFIRGRQLPAVTGTADYVPARLSKLVCQWQSRLRHYF